MIVLDTNVISELFRPRPELKVIDWLESITGDVAITTITLAELLAGVARLPDEARKLKLESAFRAALEPYRATQSLLAFDVRAAERYAEVLEARAAAGLPISTADAQIAAICLAHDATCATRNVKDFRHTGVDVVNPWGE